MCALVTGVQTCALPISDKRPDWSVNAAYGRREPNYGDLVTLGVTIDLPFFSKKRQDPKIAARASEATRARPDREAAQRDIAAPLDADLAAHRMPHEQLTNARSQLVRPDERRVGNEGDRRWATGWERLHKKKK